MIISIIGDSFSSDHNMGSWIAMLSENNTVYNYSQRGSSEYRIYKNLVDNLEQIKKSDRVIVFHTNPDRVYIPDTVNYPTRQLASHKNCDMLINDVFSKNSWKSIADLYYRHFFDQQYQLDIWQLMFDKINNLLKEISVLNFTGFDINYMDVTSISSIKTSNPGNINHLDLLGNQAVYNIIVKLI